MDHVARRFFDKNFDENGELAAAGIESSVDGGVLRARAADGAVVSRTLAGAEIYPSALIPQTASLEKVFLDLTGGG